MDANWANAGHVLLFFWFPPGMAPTGAPYLNRGSQCLGITLQLNMTQRDGRSVLSCARALLKRDT
jgi:hypothetical protein